MLRYFQAHTCLEYIFFSELDKDGFNLTLLYDELISVMEMID